MYIGVKFNLILKHLFFVRQLSILLWAKLKTTYLYNNIIILRIL